MKNIGSSTTKSGSSLSGGRFEANSVHVVALERPICAPRGLRMRYWFLKHLRIVEFQSLSNLKVNEKLCKRSASMICPTIVGFFLEVSCLIRRRTCNGPCSNVQHKGLLGMTSNFKVSIKVSEFLQLLPDFRLAEVTRLTNPSWICPT